MVKLTFRKVTQDVENCGFDCGISSINEYVENSYYPAITQDAYAYSISYDKKIIGYYQIMFREVQFDDLPDELSELDPCIKPSCVSAVHLRFIAIDKKYQGKGFGRQTLDAAMALIRTYPFGKADKVWLSYEPENVRAREIYRKYGFVENGEMCGNEIIAVYDL